MSHYSNEFKEAFIKKSLLPGAPSLRSLALSHGIALTTAYGWKRMYGKSSSMKKNNKTPKQKLKIIIEASSLEGEALGEFLRKEGLYTSDIESWKEEFFSSQNGPGRPKKDPELSEAQKKAEKLERELRRKDKALAEMSARIILLKKSHEIWGDPEDDE